MAKGEQRIAITASSGGNMFSAGGRKGKQSVGIDFTPEGAFGVTAALIGMTLLLHIVGRFLH